MELYKRSKVILSLAQVIYLARKSMSMGQTFIIGTIIERKKEKGKCAGGPPAHIRGVRVIYDMSMLISKPPLFTHILKNKAFDRANASVDIAPTYRR